MSYDVRTIAVFERQAKKLIKKYPSLKQELTELIIKLRDNPTLGTSLGKSCYKVRIAIKSKNKGKSGGARLISYVVFKEETVYLISIYEKGDKDQISDKEIIILLEAIIEE